MKDQASLPVGDPVRVAVIGDVAEAALEASPLTAVVPKATTVTADLEEGLLAQRDDHDITAVEPETDKAAPVKTQLGDATAVGSKATGNEFPEVPGAPPSDDALSARLRTLLSQVDLQTTTEKSLRKMLEEEFACDLMDRKPLIHTEVEAFLVATSVEDAEQDEEEEPAATKRPRSSSGGSSGFGSSLSAAMQAFLGVDSMPRTQVVKAIWAHIRESNLQDPCDKRKILLDDKLKTLFTSPLTMFTMNKQLSKHCKAGGSSSGGTTRDRSPLAKKARKKSAEDSDVVPKKANGFTKQLEVSNELASVIGRPTISRPELTKFMWAYFKDKGLQDPSNKSFIKSDAMLLKLTGQKRFQAFGMMKLLGKHLGVTSKGKGSSKHAVEFDKEESADDEDSNA